LFQNVRYALRQLMRSPGYAVVAVLTLAIGIGANAAIFSLVEAALLRRLPFSEPKHLVAVWERNPRGNARNQVSSVNFTRWQERARSFDSLSAFAAWPATLSGTGDPVRVRTGVVTSRFFDTCREKGITAFNYQGALLLMLFKQPPREDDADNPVRVGFGAPCPADLWEPFEQRFGVRLVDVYGMTEIAIATANSLDERKIGTGGRAAEGYEVRIVDADDRPVAPDTPGEIVVRPTKPDILIQ